jgi:hypothetical protein
VVEALDGERFGGVQALGGQLVGLLVPADAVAGVSVVPVCAELEGVPCLRRCAKAENMHSDPGEANVDLRSDWGRFTSAYVRDALRDVEEQGRAGPEGTGTTASSASPPHRRVG